MLCLGGIAGGTLGVCELGGFPRLVFSSLLQEGEKPGCCLLGAEAEEGRSLKVFYLVPLPSSVPSGLQSRDRPSTHFPLPENKPPVFHCGGARNKEGI